MGMTEEYANEYQELPPSCQFHPPLRACRKVWDVGKVKEVLNPNPTLLWNTSLMLVSAGISLPLMAA
jgi:hypothetical protein